MEGGRRKSRKLDLRQQLFRIPANINIALGLQWNFVGADPVDLDASCVAMGKGGECLEAIFYNNLTCSGEAGEYMKHSGDNTTGEDAGDDDDETLFFDMSKIPTDVYYLMVCVTSYTGADFTLVEKASCIMRNMTTGEKVGEFQLGIIGAHTGTLLCAISRVPPDPATPDEPTFWDLRELGFPCSGYTFVELIPTMQELINVPPAERAARQLMLPAYSLVKDPSQRSRDIVPSVMKFAIGWDGDNDLDCFLVMLDEKDEYIDHVYAKHGKIHSREGAAEHSGDKLNGFAGDGDDEFIDLDVNKLRKDVHRVFFCVSLFSGFALNLGDVPNCYCRIQNRAPTEMFSEVDRSNISRFGGSNMTLIFSTIVRKDPVRFEYVRLHEGMADGRDWIDCMPYIRFISRFLTSQAHEHWGGINLQHQGSAALSNSAHIQPEEYKLQVGWNAEWPVHRATVIGKLFGIEVRVAKVEHLTPLEPHHFACHIESWLWDHKCKDKQKSAICYDRDKLEWDAEDPKNRSLFAVQLYDRIRIMVYEHSICGFVDLEVLEMPSLFDGEEVRLRKPLAGKLVGGEVEVTCRHVPLNYVPGHQEKKGMFSYCSMM